MKENKTVLEIKDIYKSYRFKNKKLEILNNVSMKFQKGKFYAIMGHSGSGKSTFINILGLMDSFDSGVVLLNDLDVSKLKDHELSKLRMKNYGFIFQDFQLDQDLNAIENVILPMLINKEIKKDEQKNKAQELLTQFGLIDRLDHFPKEMSVGEQQRVAIARSLANNPKIILADEPTGNLDKKNEKEVFTFLKELTKQEKCVIVVSHSDYIKEFADYVFYIEDKEIVGDKE